LIKARLTAFKRAQQVYTAAHEKVHAAEATLKAAQTQLGALKPDQDQAVDELACALVADGQPRANPFSAFGPMAPGKLMELRAADGARAIHQLVAAVQRTKGLSKPTLQAAQTAERKAAAVESALTQIEKRRDALREARHTRAAHAQTWATALAALKRGARAAADDGAPNLYATLFDRPSRPNGKSAKARPAPIAPTPPPATPTAAS